MARTVSKVKVFKLITIVAITFVLIYFLLNTTNLIKNRTGTFMIENGSLSYEEVAERVYNS